MKLPRANRDSTANHGNSQRAMTTTANLLAGSNACHGLETERPRSATVVYFRWQGIEGFLLHQILVRRISTSSSRTELNTRESYLEKLSNLHVAATPSQIELQKIQVLKRQRANEADGHSEAILSYRWRQNVPQVKEGNDRYSNLLHKINVQHEGWI